MISPSPSSRRSGFTLLEMVLAMMLLALLGGMVFGISRNSLALGNAVLETQKEEMLQQAFFELLSQRFSALPGNTRFDLQVKDSGIHYITDLTLQNVPLGFTWGGQERIAKAIQLSTVKKRTGYLDIVLRYYENEILEGSESISGTIGDQKPFAEIVLLEDVRYFEWRLLDGRSMEWSYDWEIEGRMPMQAELILAFGAEGREIRQIFWIPPRQNPEIVLRQMMQSGGQQSGAGGGGGPNGGQDGGNPVTIPVGDGNPVTVPGGAGNPIQVTPRR